MRAQQGFAYAPSMVTVVDEQGHPLLQNASSVGFYGYLAPSKWACPGAAQVPWFWDLLFNVDKVGRRAGCGWDGLGLDWTGALSALCGCRWLMVHVDVTDDMLLR